MPNKLLGQCHSIIKNCRYRKTNTMGFRGAVKNTATRRAMFKLGIYKRVGKTIEIDRQKIQTLSPVALYKYITNGVEPVFAAPHRHYNMSGKRAHRATQKAPSLNEVNPVYSFLESLAIRAARVSGVVKPSKAVSAQQLASVCANMKKKCGDGAEVAIEYMVPVIDQLFTNIESGAFGISNPFKESSI